jgi:alpha-beta hydrolase superfamily lysophospholipase
MTWAQPANSSPQVSDNSRDTVIVVHGLGRTKLSMSSLAARLRDEGYSVVGFSYPSTKQSVADSAAQLELQLQAVSASSRGRVHLVAHSLGGIVVRAALRRSCPANLGRVVMLGPPNRGSEIADRLRNNLFYKIATGPAGQELGTEYSSTPNRLGAATFEVGVIAGNRSLNPLFSAWLPGADDGKVSVQRTRLAGMTDFLVVPHSHTFIMCGSKVGAQVVHFLEYGCFAMPRA